MAKEIDGTIVHMQKIQQLTWFNRGDATYFAQLLKNKYLQTLI
jgi:hypothetical protein